MDGWDILDNAPGDYRSHWKQRGKAWDTGLSNNSYDIVFSSHTLEHIPHFRIEQTIAEFNRIMKIGGTIRLLVPDLKKAATAYVNGNRAYFEKSAHPSDHLGMGGMFMSVVVSPGSQTLALSREMDEIIGGYAHLYGYDFDMFRILLEKWGFEEVKESPFCGSSTEELNQPQGVICDGKIYELSDPFFVNKEYKKSGKEWNFIGFDKRPESSLIIEAKKKRDEVYALDKEFPHNQRGRFNSRADRIRLRVLRPAMAITDVCLNLAVGLVRIFRMGK